MLAADTIKNRPQSLQTLLAAGLKEKIAIDYEELQNKLFEEEEQNENELENATDRNTVTQLLIEQQDNEEEGDIIDVIAQTSENKQDEGNES